MVGRCLLLNSSRTQELHNWRKPGNGDLGAWVERVVKVFDAAKSNFSVTVEEIDSALHKIAARCRCSAPEVRATADHSRDASQDLESLLRRLQSHEIKWLVRILLKDLSPVMLDPNHILRSFHFLLPGLLKFQNSLSHALALLRGPMKQYHANPDPLLQALLKQNAAKLLKPQVGVKVGQPYFCKSWSFKHCMDLIREKRWIIERKYDGEYCEIHIDMDNESDWIAIFSKSGKNSTRDRKGIHKLVRRCLRIDQPDCQFDSKCILVGEMVVFSENDQTIQEFHRIRDHVARSRRYIGTDFGGEVQKDEHLMVIFHDVLLVDDIVTTTMPLMKRREFLSRLIHKIPGYATTSEWKQRGFSKSHSDRILMYHLVDALAKKAEGLVLKPADSPYFSFRAENNSGHVGCFINVKKDYMTELGGERDVSDLAVIGAGFDPKVALKVGIKGLRFTRFYLGCLVNPDDVRFGRTPRFEVVGYVEAGPGIPNPVLKALNTHGYFHHSNDNSDSKDRSFIIVKPWYHEEMAVFTTPCVVEVLGNGYDKPSGKNFCMLRHPRIVKIHTDRSWKDTPTFEELRELANKSRNEASVAISPEMNTLYAKIKARYDAKRQRESRGRSPLSALDQSSPIRNLPSSPYSRMTTIGMKRESNECDEGDDYHEEKENKKKRTV
jgi:DNA ligase 4